LLALVDSTNPQVREQAIRALGKCPTEESVNKLLALLAGDNVNELMATCAALGQLKDPRAITPLVATIERSVQTIRDNNVRMAAGDALEAITGKQYGPYEQQWRRALDGGQLE
jgi:HEAT repeat protein